MLTDKGIEERGNHEELLRKDGIYAELNKYAEKHIYNLKNNGT